MIFAIFLGYLRSMGKRLLYFFIPLCTLNGKAIYGKDFISPTVQRALPLETPLRPSNPLARLLDETRDETCYDADDESERLPLLRPVAIRPSIFTLTQEQRRFLVALCLSAYASRQ